MSKTNASQVTGTIVMVSPDQFGFNPETAATNVFQNKPDHSAEIIRKSALKEFRNMVTALKSYGINILVLPSRKDVLTPDAVFPNNWFSHHQDNTLVIYPMLTLNRRAERQVNNLLELFKRNNINHKTIDLSKQEDEEKILEGTGSMVLDRESKVAFAMESPRTTQAAFLNWCKIMRYEPVFFHAYDKKSLPIYHTNVVMSIGKGFVVYCPESIKNPQEKQILEKKFSQLKKEIIPITITQVYAFCGNILHLKSTAGKKKIILSTNAFNSFTSLQKTKLKKYGELVQVDIPTIEKIGGGSARCMMAEIF